MITFITHLRVSPANSGEFEEVVAEMTRKARENEPGIVYYGFSRSTEDHGTYVVIEVYRDEAAIKAHWDTDYIKPLLARASALVENQAFDTKRYENP